VMVKGISMALSVSSVGSSPLQPPSLLRVDGYSINLSVSSVGSSPLQPRGSVCLRERARTFSILGRIEPTATVRELVLELGEQVLSVSSVGSSPLQLLKDPLTTLSKYIGLSVSSVGSSPLQPIIGFVVLPTLALSVSSVGSSPLQPPCPRRTGEADQPFSILGRIEPTATPLNWASKCSPMKLSVSSVGSSPLQRDLLRAFHTSQELSVSSVGSSPLQLIGAATGSGTIKVFQYPRSDRAHCNHSGGTPGLG